MPGNVIDFVYINDMGDRYKGVFRNGTNRMLGYDYSRSNHYFITVCVKDREHCFGQIRDQQMYLSELGEIVRAEWLKTVEIRKSMNLQLGGFVVMPDHFHAIIFIGLNDHNQDSAPNSMGIQSQNLGSIIRGFKAVVTTYARKNGISFDWQPRYHDRVIRN